MRKLRKTEKRKCMKFHFIYKLISKVKGDISNTFFEAPPNFFKNISFSFFFVNFSFFFVDWP
jgi:hypothetical protein